MSRLRSFLRLGRTERKRLLGAVTAVAGTRLLLWVLPYRRARSVLDRTAGGGTGMVSRPAQLDAPERIAREVARAAPAIPGANCLIQALAAEWLIKRSGAAVTIRFGVAQGEHGIEAHAWLEYGGQVILGGEGAARFTPLGRAVVSGTDARAKPLRPT